MTDFDTEVNEAAETMPEPEPFNLDGFAGGAAESAPVEDLPAPLDPYTDQEIAELAATLSAFGLPLEVMSDYTAAFVMKAAPILGMLQAGDALAEMGLHKGSGIGQAPAWVRALAAGAGLAYVVVSTRKEFGGASNAGVDAGRGAGRNFDDEQSEGFSDVA